MSGIAGKDKSMSEFGKKGRSLVEALVSMFNNSKRTKSSWESNKK